MEKHTLCWSEKVAFWSPMQHQSHSEAIPARGPFLVVASREWRRRYYSRRGNGSGKDAPSPWVFPTHKGKPQTLTPKLRSTPRGLFPERRRLVDLRSLELGVKSQCIGVSRYAGGEKSREGHHCTSTSDQSPVLAGNSRNEIRHCDAWCCLVSLSFCLGVHRSGRGPSH